MVDSTQRTRRLTATTLLISTSAVLGITALIVGAAVVLGLMVPDVRAHIDVLIVAVLLAQSSGALMALMFILRRRGHTLSAIGFSRPSRRLLHVVWQIPLAVVAVLSAQLLVFAVSGSEPVSESSTDSIAANAGPLAAITMFAAIAIITPVWEELFFRGVIYGYVRGRLGAVSAVTISAVIFALCHGVPILLPYMVALGLCLALLREFHGNLWAPLALHMTINSTASFVLVQAVFT